MIANPNYGLTNFDTIFYSLINVFICITLEGWTEVMYQLVDAFSIFVILYFVLLVFIGGFFLVNLTLAVIKGKFTDMQNFGEEVNEVHEDTDNIDIQQIKNFRRMERLFIRKIVLKNVMAAKYGGLKNQNLDYLDQFSAAHNFEYSLPPHTTSRRRMRLRARLAPIPAPLPACAGPQLTTRLFGGGAADIKLGRSDKDLAEQEAAGEAQVARENQEQHRVRLSR